SEDQEIEMVLFIPIVDYERDPNSQSVFVKNEYYSDGGKVIPGSYNNNLRLKVRCGQEVNDENAIVRVLVKDYVGQSNSFIVRVVFPYHNNRFKYLMNSARPNESVLFVIGLMEVIQDDLCVYAVETSYVDSCFLDKKKVTSSNDSQSSSGLCKSVRSRLLVAYRDANENSSKEFNAESNNKRGEADQSTSESSVSNSYSSKRVRVEDEVPNHVDSDYIEDESEYDKGFATNIESEESVIDECKNTGRDYGKGNREDTISSVVHNTRKRTEMLKGANNNVAGGEYKKN
ncbi:24072_t:CDS:2, partial [Racocetra persica]